MPPTDLVEAPRGEICKSGTEAAAEEIARLPPLAARFLEPPGFTWGSFAAADGARLRWGHLPAAEPRAECVMVGGFSECIEKYFETIGDLAARGLSVWCLDRRGQGGSDRPRRWPSRPRPRHFERDAGELHLYPEPAGGAPATAVDRPLDGWCDSTPLPAPISGPVRCGDPVGADVAVYPAPSVCRPPSCAASPVRPGSAVSAFVLFPEPGAGGPSAYRRPSAAAPQPTRTAAACNTAGSWRVPHCATMSRPGAGSMRRCGSSPGSPGRSFSPRSTSRSCSRVRGGRLLSSRGAPASGGAVARQWHSGRVPAFEARTVSRSATRSAVLAPVIDRFVAERVARQAG